MLLPRLEQRFASTARKSAGTFSSGVVPWREREAMALDCKGILQCRDEVERELVRNHINHAKAAPKINPMKPAKA
jgi:hypothetical protein